MKRGTLSILAPVLAVFVSGCVPTTFVCQTNDECGANGLCVANNCAFPDDECASGLRFGKYAANANACVEDDMAQGSESAGESSTTAAPETGTDTGTSTDTDTGTETGTDTMVDPAVVIAHYSFDDITDPPVIVDKSGNGFDAEMDFFQMSVAGVSGLGLEFQGDDRLIVPPAVLADRSSFTVEFYMLDSAPGPSNQWLFYYGDSQALGTPPNLTLHAQFDQDPMKVAVLRWTDGGGQSTTNTGTASIVDGWHHMAVTVDAGGLLLYVDHQLDGSPIATPSLPDAALNSILVGAIPELQDGFVGVLDELRFSEGALVPEQMLPLP